MEQYRQLEGYQPQEALRRFWDISQIPRQPGKMQPISDWLRRYIEGLRLPVSQDDHWNLIARKPASPGCESAPSVMLQAHMDMVCERDPGVEHDFSRDPLKLQVDENGKVTAQGTTLGADDGVGVAAALAILADNTLQHPELEVVFTADEETDMNGAFALDYPSIRSRIILNLDAFPIQVAGSGELELVCRMEKGTEPIRAGAQGFRLTIDGLQGGHTGQQAMLERGNAIAYLNRLLLALEEQTAYQLVDLAGGADFSTAFARRADAVIALMPDRIEAAEAAVSRCREAFERELRVRDPGVVVRMEPLGELPEQALSEQTARTLRTLIALLPDGVLSLDQERKGSMESCSNVGIVRAEGETLFLSTTIRSSLASKKYYALKKAQLLCDALGVRHEVVRDLPEWNYQVEDRLLALVQEIYPDTPLRISQGTLEAGIFLANLPGASCLAIAPPYYNAHSPREYFMIAEFKQAYDRLLQLLARLAE